MRSKETPNRTGLILSIAFLTTGLIGYSTALLNRHNTPVSPDQIASQPRVATEIIDGKPRLVPVQIVARPLNSDTIIGIKNDGSERLSPDSIRVDYVPNQNVDIKPILLCPDGSPSGQIMYPLKGTVYKSIKDLCKNTGDFCEKNLDGTPQEFQDDFIRMWNETALELGSSYISNSGGVGNTIKRALVDGCGTPRVYFAKNPENKRTITLKK